MMKSITNQNYFKTSDGKYLYFEDYGKGTPILMLPGSNCSTKFFKNNVDDLSKNHRLILMDLRSHGRSSKTLEGNNLESHARDIHELIEHLCLTKVTLIGWSLSGSTIISYCKKYGCDKLVSIVLLDSVVYPFSDSEFNSYRYSGMKVDNWLEDRMETIFNYDTFVDNFANRMSDLSTSEDIEFIKNEVEKVLPESNLELHFDYCMTDNEKNLHFINVPVGLFYAKSNHYGTGLAFGYQKLIKSKSKIVTFDKGGHMAFYFDSENFNKELLQFISEVEEWTA